MKSENWNRLECHGIDRRQVDSGLPEARVHLFPILPLPLAGAPVQRERITKQDIDEFGTAVDIQRAPDRRGRCRLRVTPQGAERLDRSSEVVNEALLEECKRNDQKKNRGREGQRQHHRHRKEHKHHMD